LVGAGDAPRPRRIAESEFGPDRRDLLARRPDFRTPVAEEKAKVGLIFRS
jgi:hypothetical protein